MILLLTRVVAVAAQIAAAEPKAPAPREIQEIQQAIDRSKQALAKLRDQRDKMKPVEDALGINRDKNDQPTRSLSEHELARLTPQLRELYDSGTRAESQMINAVYETHKRAIALTSEYFRIAPNPDSTPLLRLPQARDNIDYWKPRFSDRRITVGGGRLETPEEMLDMPALFRYEDGVVAVRRGAFKYPGYLALCLQHVSQPAPEPRVREPDCFNDPDWGRVCCFANCGN